MQTHRSLRILLVTNNYTPYAGGIVNSLLVTMRALRALGHKPLLVTLDFAPTANFESDVVRLYCPIKFYYCGNPMALPLYARTQLYYIIKQFRPDIIHAQHPFLLGPHALSLARALSIPALFTYHTQYHEQAHYIPLPRFLVTPLIAQYVRNFCNKCDAVIMPTSMVQKRCDSWLQVPTCVIPSGIDERYYCSDNKLSESPIQLLTVGRMVPEKKVTLLLDVISMLEIDYQFTLIGYGYQYEYLQHYAYQTKKLSPERVHFIHQPSKELIADWYAKADLFLFAAPYDTQGLVLAESMASSTPVIALPGPGQQEIIQNGYNGFLVQSVEEMVATVRMLNDQRVLLHQLQEGAWQTAQAYRPQVCTQKLVDLYCSLI